jgi:hypothetical protein
MHINTKQADQMALVCALAPVTSGTQRGADSAAERVSLMPYIGVGTFLVAAYLRSDPATHELPDRKRAGPEP